MAGGGTIVAAVLLPPLGVALARRPYRDVWIAVGLTMLGVVPGTVFALVQVLRPERAA